MNKKEVSYTMLSEMEARLDALKRRVAALEASQQRKEIILSQQERET